MACGGSRAAGGTCAPRPFDLPFIIHGKQSGPGPDARAPWLPGAHRSCIPAPQARTLSASGVPGQQQKPAGANAPRANRARKPRAGAGDPGHEPSERTQKMAKVTRKLSKEKRGRRRVRDGKRLRKFPKPRSPRWDPGPDAPNPPTRLFGAASGMKRYLDSFHLFFFFSFPRTKTHNQVVP